MRASSSSREIASAKISRSLRLLKLRISIALGDGVACNSATAATETLIRPIAVKYKINRICHCRQRPRLGLCLQRKVRLSAKGFRFRGPVVRDGKAGLSFAFLADQDGSDLSLRSGEVVAADKVSQWLLEGDPTIRWQTL